MPFPRGGSAQEENKHAGGNGRLPPLFNFAPYRLPAKRYEAVFARGASVACGSMVLKWTPNGLDKTCLGVVSAKKVFRLAVQRSRVRRLMREAFRLERPRLKAGFDLVLLGRRRLAEQDCRQTRRDLLWLCRKAGLIDA